MTTNDRYFQEFPDYCEIMVPGREMRRVPKARIDDPEAPQGRRWGDMVALAKEVDRLRELLWQAVDEAITVSDMQERFQKDMLQPGTHIVPEEPQPVPVEEAPSGPPQPVFVPQLSLYTGTGRSQPVGEEREEDQEYEDKEHKSKRRKGK